MKITTIGIDLAKTIFQIHGINDGAQFSMRAETLNRTP